MIVERQILVQADLESAAGCEAQLRELLERTQRLCCDEPGVLTYRFSSSLTFARRFHAVELWQSEAAFQAHLIGPAFRSFLAELPEWGRVLKSQRLIGELNAYAQSTEDRTTA